MFLRSVIFFFLFQFTFSGFLIAGTPFAYSFPANSNIIHAKLNEETNASLNYEHKDDPVKYYVSRVGRGEVPAGSPFSFKWNYTMSQTLYLADEIGVSSGTLKGIEYRMHNNLTIRGTHLTIWVGNTKRENLVQNWEDIFAMQRVYEKNVDFPAGEKYIFIPFDVPFEYQGDNLVIHMRVATQTLSGDSYFYTTEITTASRIKLSQRDNIPFDVDESDEIGRLLYNLPNINFYFYPENLQAIRELEETKIHSTALSESALITPVRTAERPIEPERERTPRPTVTETRAASHEDARKAVIFSRDTRSRFSLGLDLSLNLYDGDYLNAMILPGADLSFGFLQNRSISFDWNFGVGRVESVDIFHANFAQTALGIKYRPFNFNTYGSPFIQGGGGILYHTQGTRFVESELSFDRNLMYFVNFSLGYEWLLNRWGGLTVALGNRQLLSDNIDGLVHGKYNDRIWSLNLGFKIYLNTGAN